MWKFIKADCILCTLTNKTAHETDFLKNVFIKVILLGQLGTLLFPLRSPFFSLGVSQGPSTFRFSKLTLIMTTRKWSCINPLSVDSSNLINALSNLFFELRKITSVSALWQIYTQITKKIKCDIQENLPVTTVKLPANLMRSLP